MIHYNVFAGGKKKVVTFSYDDGPSNDSRLVELFNKYGVKGSFHLNSCKYKDITCSQLENIAKTYKGHEISCHTVHHGILTQMPDMSIINEVIGDRQLLEKIAGYPVVGMSYPYGDHDARVIDILKKCGIVYSRTVRATNGFNIPEDFLAWHPTCHHNGALPLCKEFVENERWGSRPLFYIWGHSYEFDTEEKWDYMESVLKILAGRDDIWYATNIEIYDYVMAQRTLRISADEKTFTNPTCIDVWFEKDRKDIICVPAGKTVTL